jgi:hypothetical protein
VEAEEEAAEETLEAGTKGIDGGATVLEAAPGLCCCCCPGGGMVGGARPVVRAIF